MNSPKISDLVGIINKIAPQRFAEDWDNVGLQVGDASESAGRIMVALDPTRETVAAAVAQDCRLLITHHPLIFSPLKKIVDSDPVSAVVARAIRHGLAVLALHTNFDVAAGGVNDLLAERLEVQSPAPLKVTGREELVKMSVFVPHGHEEQVMEALFRFSGIIGNYRDCSFRCDGVGTFLPQEGARPFVGEIGRREQVEECRVEVLVRSEDLGAATAALRQAHPYEEPAYDLYPLLNRGATRGMGRIGELAEAMPLARFAGRVKECLNAGGVKYVGAPDRQIRKVALCGGSGVSLMREAIFQGADVLVTGDVKYHDAREAQALGMALVDAGHFATELPMVDGLADRLGRELTARKFEAVIMTFTGEREPFSYV